MNTESEGELTDAQINFKVAKALGWHFKDHDWNSAWHDDLGDGPPMDYCKAFGRGIAELILSRK